MNFIHHLMPFALMLSMIVDFGAGSAGTNPPATKSYGGLAQGFFIPNFNLLTDELQAVGSTIFDSLPSDCIVTNNLGQSQKDFTHFSNTESLYKTVSVNFGIGASLIGPYTLGTSLAAVTNNIVSGNTEVSGLSLNLREYSKDLSLKKDCINKQPLDKQFLKDFETLDNEINQPSKSHSWIKYKIFLKKYGSHVVKKVKSGSSIQQYVFAESSKQYGEHAYKVKACLSFGGLTGYGNIGVSGCNGISKDEIKSAGSLSTVEKLVIRGGTSKTRAQLTNDVRDKNTIGTFLQEGSSSPSPIVYKFVPIWDLLKTRFVGTPSMAKVLNLEQFFKGYLNFGCAFQKTSNNVEVLQKFVLSKDSDPNLPTYKCMLGPTGCHTDKDCHYMHPFWCACAGDSCIKHQTVKLKSGTTKKEAYPQTKLSPGWNGHGCKFRVKCKCKKENKNLVVSWSGDTAGEGLRDIHYALAKRRSHVGRGKRH